jgi:hypothetical protein
MLKKILSVFLIVMASLLIGWGFVTTGILLWNVQTVSYPNHWGFLGFSLDVSIFGIIPIVIGMMILFRKRIFREKSGQSAEEDTSTQE